MIPKIVIIVPYRDRKNNLDIFEPSIKKFMNNHLGKPNYKVFFVHQKDNRPFNRGAMKNIGFIMCKNLYPNYYKEISFVFNDVDTIPNNNSINFITSKGIIKDFYGVPYALHGFFSITGEDFEKIGGFPNFWHWGLEDNAIYDKALQNGLIIDRSIYFPLEDNLNVIKLNDSLIKNVSDKQFWDYRFKNYDSLKNLKNINMKLDNNFINVYYFLTEKLHDSYDFVTKKVDTIMYADFNKVDSNLNRFIKPKYKGNFNEFFDIKNSNVITLSNKFKKTFARN